MILRPLTDHDREAAIRFLAAHLRKFLGPDAPPPPADLLPLVGLAARAAEDDEDPAAVSFLYLDQTSPVAVVGWTVANPANSIHASADAIDAIFAALPDLARQLGARWLLSYSGNRAINRTLDRLGFVTTEAAENKMLRL